MEPTQNKFEADLKLLRKAAGTLEDALRLPYSDIVRDAVIQRFEYVFELSWKTLQAAAGYMGTPCNSPREAMKFAFKMTWLSDFDAWIDAMEARNKTSHTYNEAIAEEVYAIAKTFPKLIAPLVQALSLVKK